MRSFHLATAAVLALLGGAGAAWAHAHLKTATPLPDSTVQAVPKTVSIDFTEGVEPKFSSIAVQDSAGLSVIEGEAATAPGDNKRLSIGVKPLPPGTYKVIWHATAVDTHKTEGTYQFTVKP